METEKVKLIGGAADGQILDVAKGRLALDAVGESGTGLKAVCTSQTYRRTDEMEGDAVIFRAIEEAAPSNQPIDESPVEQVIGSAIEILRIQKGDAVIVRADMTNETQMEFIVGAMSQVFTERGLGPADVSLLIIPSNIDLKVLNAEQMKRSGWERTARILTPGNGLRP